MDATDTTQPTFGLTPPALDAFGGPHFTDEHDAVASSRQAWIGDPSSVPLPEQADDEHHFDGAQRVEAEGAELDRAIFAALVTP
jgi:hypothetical protein